MRIAWDDDEAALGKLFRSHLYNTGLRIRIRNCQIPSQQPDSFAFCQENYLLFMISLSCNEVMHENKKW
jgi:hypothetical protein